MRHIFKDGCSYNALRSCNPHMTRNFKDDLINSLENPEVKTMGFVETRVENARKINASVMNHAGEYPGVIKSTGLKGVVEKLRKDTVLDGYGSIMDTLADNMYGVFIVIFLAILIPVISSMVVTNLNITLGPEWGTVTGAGIWSAVAPVIVVVVTIGFIAILFKVFSEMKMKKTGRR